jgi:hypothetical protein
MQNPPMKITVIGTINKDLILPFQGAPIESYGGIFYNTAILSQLTDKEDEIIPVSFIGEDVYTPAMAVLKKLPRVSTDGLIPIDQKNHKVILEYQSPSQRKEKALFNFPPLTWKQIKPFLGSDIIIVNMITGWDIEEKAFFKIAKQQRKKLYLDVHFLVMGADKLGRRFPKRPDKIERWLNGSHFVQMNRMEYQIIAGDTAKEDFFKQNLQRDQILIITDGKHGADMVRVDYGKIDLKHYPAFKLPAIVDATGCGDAFGAGFVHKYLKTNEIEESIRFANQVAAANAMLKGTNEMPLLKETMEKIMSRAE